MKYLFEYDNNDYDHYLLRFWIVNSGFILFWVFGFPILILLTNWWVGAFAILFPLLTLKKLIASTKFHIKSIKLIDRRVIDIHYLVRSLEIKEQYDIESVDVSIHYPRGRTLMTIIGEPFITFKFNNELEIKQYSYQNNFEGWNFENLKNAFLEIKSIKKMELSDKEVRILERIGTHNLS